MDRAIFASVLEMYDKDRLVKAVKSPDQSALDIYFEAKGLSNRILLKRAPEIVEGDLVDAAITVTNTQSAPFPGGRLAIGIQYAGDKNQVPVVDIPSLESGEKRKIQLGTLPALKEGMANVYAYGQTSARQAVVILTNRTQICIPEASFACFRVWPLSSVYSTITIILAAFSLLVAMMAFSFSILR